MVLLMFIKLSIGDAPQEVIVADCFQSKGWETRCGEAVAP